jgi:glycine/D-amino acid oxidase-like deaminating enzyme
MVGGGFTGLAASYTLSSQGANVALFEAQRLGSGASGRTGGVVLEDPAAGPLPDTGDCIPALQRILNKTGIECDLELAGCWELAHAAAGPKLWRDGDRDLVIHETVPGGTLDPGRLIDGLARAALQGGATLHEYAPVTRISGKAPLRLQIGNQEVRADHVVLGLNAYTPSLIPVGEDFHPALTLALCTKPLAPGTLEAIGLADRRPFYTVDMPFLWGRPLGDDRLIFGGCLAFDVGKQVRQLDLRASEVAQSLAHLEGRIRELHPALADAQVDKRWGGPVAFRSNRSPILCRHESLPGLILTGAYAGHGIALSVGLGELAAQAILEDRALPDWGQVAWPSEALEVG